jgi:hypothetical protein
MKVDVATLPNWEFDILEVSPSFYKLKAVHTLGPSIEMTGSDDERLLSEAKAAARTWNQKLPRRYLSERNATIRSRGDSGSWR